MIKNVNIRIFRRNKKNLIVIWNKDQLKEEHNDFISVDLMKDDKISPLSFEKFIPFDKNKFSKETDGIIISHEENNLDSAKQYEIRVVLGRNDKIQKNITVLPTTSIKINTQKQSGIEAWDDKNKRFEKLYGEWVENRFVLLTKEAK